MRVVFVTPFPPSRAGIADYAARLVDAVAAEHPDCDITVHPVGRGNGRGNGRGDGRGRALSWSPRTWARLYRELRADPPDVVHVQFDLSSYLLLVVPLVGTLAALRRRGTVRLVATYHEAYRDLDLYGPAAVAFYRAFGRLFDRIYVHTRLSARRLVDSYGTAPHQVVCIPHGAPAFASRRRNHEELRQRHGIPAGRPVVLTVGFLYRTKGIEYLIEALALLRAAGGPLPAVLIAGEVPRRAGILRLFQARNDRYLAALRRQVHRAGLDQVVTFTGYVAADELYSVLTLADVVVLPYLSVDQSGVLNAAIAARTPVVASDLGGLGETLRDVGELVPPRDSAAIAAAVAGLLADPVRRAALSARYAELAEALDLRQVAAALVRDYGRLTAEPATAR